VAARTALSEPGPAQRYTVQEPGERHMTPGPGGNRVCGARGDRRGDGNDRDARNGARNVGAVPRRSGAAVAVPGPPSVAARTALAAVEMGRTQRAAPRRTR